MVKETAPFLSPRDISPVQVSSLQDLVPRVTVDAFINHLQAGCLAKGKDKKQDAVELLFSDLVANNFRQDQITDLGGGFQKSSKSTKENRSTFLRQVKKTISDNKQDYPDPDGMIKAVEWYIQYFEKVERFSISIEKKNKNEIKQLLKEVRDEIPAKPIVFSLQYDKYVFYLNFLINSLNELELGTSSLEAERNQAPVYYLKAVARLGSEHSFMQDSSSVLGVFGSVAAKGAKKLSMGRVNFQTEAKEKRDADVRDAIAELKEVCKVKDFHPQEYFDETIILSARALLSVVKHPKRRLMYVEDESAQCELPVDMLMMLLRSFDYQNNIPDTLNVLNTLLDESVYKDERIIRQVLTVVNQLYVQYSSDKKLDSSDKKLEKHVVGLLELYEKLKKQSVSKEASEAAKYMLLFDKTKRPIISGFLVPTEALTVGANSKAFAEIDFSVLHDVVLPCYMTLDQLGKIHCGAQPNAYFGALAVIYRSACHQRSRLRDAAKATDSQNSEYRTHLQRINSDIQVVLGEINNISQLENAQKGMAPVEPARSQARLILFQEAVRKLLHSSSDDREENRRNCKELLKQIDFSQFVLPRPQHFLNFYLTPLLDDHWDDQELWHILNGQPALCRYFTTKKVFECAKQHPVAAVAIFANKVFRAKLMEDVDYFVNCLSEIVSSNTMQVDDIDAWRGSFFASVFDDEGLKIHEAVYRATIDAQSNNGQLLHVFMQDRLPEKIKAEIEGIIAKVSSESRNWDTYLGIYEGNKYHLTRGGETVDALSVLHNYHLLLLLLAKMSDLPFETLPSAETMQIFSALMEKNDEVINLVFQNVRFLDKLSGNAAYVLAVAVDPTLTSPRLKPLLRRFPKANINLLSNDVLDEIISVHQPDPVVEIGDAEENSDGYCASDDETESVLSDDESYYLGQPVTTLDDIIGQEALLSSEVDESDQDALRREQQKEKEALNGRKETLVVPQDNLASVLMMSSLMQPQRLSTMNDDVITKYLMQLHPFDIQVILSNVKDSFYREKLLKVICSDEELLPKLSLTILKNLTPKELQQSYEKVLEANYSLEARLRFFARISSLKSLSSDMQATISKIMIANLSNPEAIARLRLPYFVKLIRKLPSDDDRLEVLKDLMNQLDATKPDEIANLQSAVFLTIFVIFELLRTDSKSNFVQQNKDKFITPEFIDLLKMILEAIITKHYNLVGESKGVINEELFRVIAGMIGSYQAIFTTLELERLVQTWPLSLFVNVMQVMQKQRSEVVGRQVFPRWLGGFGKEQRVDQEGRNLQIKQTMYSMTVAFLNSCQTVSSFSYEDMQTVVKAYGMGNVLSFLRDVIQCDIPQGPLEVTATIKPEDTGISLDQGVMTFKLLLMLLCNSEVLAIQSSNSVFDQLFTKITEVFNVDTDLVAKVELLNQLPEFLKKDQVNDADRSRIAYQVIWLNEMVKQLDFPTIVCLVNLLNYEQVVNLFNEFKTATEPTVLFAVMLRIFLAYAHTWTFDRATEHLSEIIGLLEKIETRYPQQDIADHLNAMVTSLSQTENPKSKSAISRAVLSQPKICGLLSSNSITALKANLNSYDREQYIIGSNEDSYQMFEQLLTVYCKKEFQQEHSSENPAVLNRLETMLPSEERVEVATLDQKQTLLNDVGSVITAGKTNTQERQNVCEGLLSRKNISHCCSVETLESLVIKLSADQKKTVVENATADSRVRLICALRLLDKQLKAGEVKSRVQTIADMVAGASESELKDIQQLLNGMLVRLQQYGVTQSILSSICQYILSCPAIVDLLSPESITALKANLNSYDLEQYIVGSTEDSYQMFEQLLTVYCKKEFQQEHSSENPAVLNRLETMLPSEERVEVAALDQKQTLLNDVGSVITAGKTGTDERRIICAALLARLNIVKLLPIEVVQYLFNILGPDERAQIESSEETVSIVRLMYLVRALGDKTFTASYPRIDLVAKIETGIDECEKQGFASEIISAVLARLDLLNINKYEASKIALKLFESDEIFNLLNPEIRDQLYQKIDFKESIQLIEEGKRTLDQTLKDLERVGSQGQQEFYPVLLARLVQLTNMQSDIDNDHQMQLGEEQPKPIEAGVAEGFENLFKVFLGLMTKGSEKNFEKIPTYLRVRFLVTVASQAKKTSDTKLLKTEFLNMMVNKCETAPEKRAFLSVIFTYYAHCFSDSALAELMKQYLKLEELKPGLKTLLTIYHEQYQNKALRTVIAEHILTDKQCQADMLGAIVHGSALMSSVLHFLSHFDTASGKMKPRMKKVNKNKEYFIKSLWVSTAVARSTQEIEKKEYESAKRRIENQVASVKGGIRRKKLEQSTTKKVRAAQDKKARELKRRHQLLYAAVADVYRQTTFPPARIGLGWRLKIAGKIRRLMSRPRLGKKERFDFSSLLNLKNTQPKDSGSKKHQQAHEYSSGLILALCPSFEEQSQERIYDLSSIPLPALVDRFKKRLDSFVQCEDESEPLKKEVRSLFDEIGQYLAFIQAQCVCINTSASVCMICNWLELTKDLDVYLERAITHLPGNDLEDLQQNDSPRTRKKLFLTELKKRVDSINAQVNNLELEREGKVDLPLYGVQK